MSSLSAKLVTLHHALLAADLPHAFGGALALAFCTQRARGTIDIDVNVFIEVDRLDELLRALPEHVIAVEADVEMLRRDGQARLWWDTTPVDVFLNTTSFHEAAMRRVAIERYEGADISFLGCSDLAVFKAFFNRTKDWADLEEMVAMGSVDVERVIGVLVDYLGPGDERIERLRDVVSQFGSTN